MTKLVITIDLGSNIPRSVMEMAIPAVEGEIKEQMSKGMKKAGMEPKNIKIDIVD